MPFAQFYPDPNGFIKVDERNLRPSSASSSSSSSSIRSTSSRYTRVHRLPHTAPGLLTEARPVQVIELPAPRPFRTEVRTPSALHANIQHLTVPPPPPPPPPSPPPPPHRPLGGVNRLTDRDSFTVPTLPRLPSHPPSPASVTFESMTSHVPPHAPEVPPRARLVTRSTRQTSLRQPPSSPIPIDQTSDPGSHISSSGRGGSRKAHSDRGHSRNHSGSTISTTASTSSRHSEAPTEATSVSARSACKKSPGLLEEAPKPLRKVRIAEEQIEYADQNGRQRISRSRYP